MRARRLLLALALVAASLGVACDSPVPPAAPSPVVPPTARGEASTARLSLRGSLVSILDTAPRGD